MATAKVKVTKVTEKQIKQYFKDGGFKPRHSIAGLKNAANRLATEAGAESAYNVLMLVLSNRPLEGFWTHSYGFHTAEGRHLIETFQTYYYDYTNRL